MKKYLLVLFTMGMAYAQDPTKIIPPSPESSSFAKFVESPVSYYNGTPDISVPFYTIEQDGVVVPISINYHAKGIQVTETASRVGAGWTLNAGGSITRQVRMRPDEAQGAWIDSNYPHDYVTNINTRNSMKGKDLEGLADWDPDLFFYNAGGHSGKFIINPSDGKLLIQKAQDLTIVGGPEASFTMTDNNGVKYHFTGMDKPTSIMKYVTTHSGAGGTAPGQQDSEIKVFNTYYLTSIETPHHTFIHFGYELEKVSYYTRTADITDLISRRSEFTHTEMDQYQLSTITFDLGTVEFQASVAAREDLNGGKALNQITVKNNENSVVKRFLFNYHYTEDNNNYNVLQFLQTDQFAKKRLFLSSVEESYPTLVNGVPISGEVSRYLFEYNPVVLPNRHSSSHDNWGYFNGQLNGQHFNTSGNPDAGMIDVEKAGAGILSKITYPTGGYSRFEYEHNRVKTPQYMEMWMPRNNPELSHSFGMLNQKTSNEGVNTTPVSNGVETSWDSACHCFVGNVTISEAVSGFVDVTVNYINGAADCADVNEPANSDCKFVTRMYKQGTSTPIYLRSGTYEQPVEPGTYRVEVKPDHGVNPDPDTWFDEDDNPATDTTIGFGISLTWRESEYDPDIQLLVGGKRIRRIVKGEMVADGSSPDVPYDEDNLPDELPLITKEFNYDDESGISTGRVFSIPNYYRMEIGGGNASAILSSAPVSSTNTGAIGYSRVTETTVGPKDIGKTEYTFTNYKDTGEFYVFPYHLPNDLEWTRGLPLTVSHYKLINGIYKPVSVTNNQYVYYNNSGSPTPDPEVLTVPDQPDPLDPGGDNLISHRKTRILIARVGHYLGPDAEPQDDEDFRLAYFLAGRVDNTQSVESQYFYDNSGNLTGTVSKKSKYYHESSIHHELTRQDEQISGIAEPLITRYFYPQDAAMSGEAEVTALAAQHRYPALLTEISKGVVKLSRQKTVYKNWATV